MEYFVPVDYEEITVTAATAVGLTAAKINEISPKGLVTIQVSAFPIAFRADGGTATAATKQQAQVGDIIPLDSITAMQYFSAIGIGGTSYLAVEYSRYERSN